MIMNEGHLNFSREEFKNEKFFSDMEIKFGVHDLAEQCLNWDKNNDFYVYTYNDVTDLYCPIVYVGIGKDKRAEVHWKGNTHSEELLEWVAYFKSKNLKLDDVVKYEVTGLSQRQAAILETYVIEKFSPECNKARYWTPDGPERTDDLRDSMAGIFTGKSHTEQTKNKLKELKTNGLVLDLFYEKNFLKRFHQTTAKDICEFINEQYGHNINPGNLWKVIHGTWKNDNVSGYALKLVSGKLKGRTIKQRVRVSYSTGKTALICSPDGEKFIVLSISSKEVGQKIGYDIERISRVLNGKEEHSAGFVGRFLTESEEKKLAAHVPLKRWVAVNGGHPEYFISATRIAKKLGIQYKDRGMPPNLGKVILGTQGYARINRKNYTGGEIWSLGDPEDISEYLYFNYEPNKHSFIVDDLSKDYIGYEKKESAGNIGVQLDNGLYKIRFRFNGKKIYIGSTYNLEIANDVCKHFEASSRQDLEGSRKLLEELKLKAGEALKPVAVEQSKAKGVSWLKNSELWVIRFSVEGKDITIGYSKSRQIAEEVAHFFVSNNKIDISGAKALLKKLRLKHNEIQPKTKLQSVVKGVSFGGYSWRVTFVVNKKVYRLGSTKNKQIAEKAALYFINSNFKDAAGAKKLLTTLKEDIGEKKPQKAKRRSKVKGVYWNEKKQVWRVCFMKNKKFVTIGTSKSKAVAQKTALRFLSDKNKDIVEARNFLKSLNQSL